MIATASQIKAATQMPGWGPVVCTFDYDAVEDKGRRRPPRSSTKSEDAVLPSSKRTQLVATTRDVMRNYVTAGWMVRCHLDYVSRFTFQARTGDEELNNQLESIIAWASKARSFDTAGRLTRSMAMRITEARTVLDGDIWWIKLTNGRVQLIEGDRVRVPLRGAPDGFKREEFIHGVKTTPSGRIQAVCVCKRGKRGSGFEFERIIPARHVWQRFYFDTTYRVDQRRGISPLATSLNMLQDIYEGANLAMAKAKVAQMFGLVIYRNVLEEAEGWKLSKRDADTEEAGEGEDTEVSSEDRYDVDPGAGPFKLELDGKDKAEFLSTNTPEGQLLEFLKFITDLGLKSLDIPYSFYDSSKVNYYGQKADMQKYENSARSKRESNQDLLGYWANWQFRLAILRDRLVLPGQMTIEDIAYEWVPTGMPWIDKLRDMKADKLALDNNLDSEIRIARRSGQDAYEIATERMDFEDWINKERAGRGLPGVSASAGATITDTDKGDDNA